jgi:hypothetical protein
MKQRRQLAVLAALIVIAAVIWVFYFRNERPVVTADNAPIAQSIRLLSVENPQLHWSALEKARKTEYKGTGRNPFSAIAAPPPAPLHPKPKAEPVVVPQPVVDLPPPPPTLPPNMKFFGYGTIPNSNSRRAFFSNGEDIYVVAEGEVLLNQYRILKVNNASLEFEEVSTGRRGTAPLVEQPAGPA